MKKILTTAALLAAVTFGGTACEGLDSSGGKTHAEKVVAQQQKDKKDKAPAADKSEKPAAPKYTTAQEQAIGSAVDYLDYEAFSRSGLIEQLEYEDFKAADAIFAVNHIKVNWFQQAAASAKDYLDYDSFSRTGLIEQLEYEGFTHAQAVHGANSVGL